MGTFSTIGSIRQQVKKMFRTNLMGLFALMAMATSATELPDNKYHNSNNLANYHQPEGGYMAYNLDHSVPTYNWAYSVRSDSSQPQLLRRFHKKSSITSHGALSPPTMASPRPYYSNKIKSDTISQGDNASGHDIRKRSPSVVPEDPFLVGGFLKKVSLPKAVKVAPIALPKKNKKLGKKAVKAKKKSKLVAPVAPIIPPLIALSPFKKVVAAQVTPFNIASKPYKKYKAKTGPLKFGGCITVKTLVAKLTLGLASPAGIICPKSVKLG